MKAKVKYNLSWNDKNSLQNIALDKPLVIVNIYVFKIVVVMNTSVKIIK